MIYSRNCSELIGWFQQNKYFIVYLVHIQLLESPIPATTALVQKASSDNISGTKRGTIDPLVSKQPEFFLKKKWSKIVKMVKMV